MSDRFKRVDEKIIQERILGRIPANTRKNTNWGVNTWNAWVKFRNDARTLGQPLLPAAEELALADPHTLNDHLCHFVLEVRTSRGDLYPANSLYNLVCALARYLREDLQRPDLNFMNSNNIIFHKFRQLLDAQMKLETERYWKYPAPSRAYYV